MTNTLNESLSALMDNEADDFELRRLLKEMESGEENGGRDELQAKWHRYHVISASLKQEIHTSPSRNLLAGIQAELADEPTPVAEDTRPQRRNPAGRGILQVLGQGAIAASMALAVLFVADMVMVADDEAGAEASRAAIAASDRAPGPPLTGELNPNTQTRVAIQSNLDEEDFSRLERVVSEQLQNTLERPELPATFDPEENR